MRATHAPKSLSVPFGTRLELLWTEHASLLPLQAAFVLVCPRCTAVLTLATRSVCELLSDPCMLYDALYLRPRKRWERAHVCQFYL